MEKEQVIPLARFQKVSTATQYYGLFKKCQSQKAKLLKQLQQLELDTEEYRQLPLCQLQAKADDILRKSYSFKYIGIKDNQIGILSKRVKPNHFKKDILPDAKPEYLATGVFYPKPLRTISRTPEKVITVDNLEQEIKKFFPRHTPKVIDHSVKVKGSWNNLKCANRNYKHLSSSDVDLGKKNHVEFSSYSRILQSMKGAFESHGANSMENAAILEIKEPDDKENIDQ